ncbi:hypothetical protein CLOM_g22221 [Closterium sp. NIES-68]|nr:hypothetical protein CLOM_g22221 [Closterium sp. NIES-68]
MAGGRGELASWFGGSERERLESSGPAEEEEEEETEEEKGEGNSEGGEGKAPSSSSGGSGSVGAIGSVLLSQQRPVIPSHQWWCRHAGSIKEASRQYSSIRWRCKGRSGQRVLSDLEETLQGGGALGDVYQEGGRATETRAEGVGAAGAGRDGGEQPGSAASGIAVDGEEKRGAAESTLYRHLHLQLVFSGRHAPVLPPVPAHSSSSPSTDPPVPPFLPTLLPAVSAALHVRRSRVGVAAFGSTTLLLPSQATQGAPSTTPLLLPRGQWGAGDGQGHGGSGMVLVMMMTMTMLQGTVHRLLQSMAPQQHKSFHHTRQVLLPPHPCRRLQRTCSGTSPLCPSSSRAARRASTPRHCRATARWRHGAWQAW